MELLLNLIWLTLAIGALLAFLRVRRRYVGTVSDRKALLALACVVVLLFPIVSASDDLHPAQAVVEEASKRVQLAVAPLHLLPTSLSLFALPALPAICVMFALIVWRPSRLAILSANPLEGTIVASAGRAPPSLGN